MHFQKTPLKKFFLRGVFAFIQPVYTISICLSTLL